MLLTKEWLAGEKMKEMTFLLLGPVNRVKNKGQPPFQTTQTQPALLRSGGQELGLPTDGSWREGTSRSVGRVRLPRSLGRKPVFLSRFIASGRLPRLRRDPKLLSAVVNLTLHQGLRGQRQKGSREVEGLESGGNETRLCTPRIP